MNSTQYIERRAFLPGFWRVSNIASGQAATPMQLAGLIMTELPMPQRCSVIGVGILLSEPLTAGLLRFEGTLDGAQSAETFDMRDAQGVRQLWAFDPGELVVQKNQRIGFQWGTNAAMLPSGVIQAALYCAVQWA